MKKTFASFSLLVFALFFVGHAEAQTADADVVQLAIARLLKKPSLNQADDMALVIDFAEKSDAVTIDIVKGLINVGNTPSDSMLMGYFIAGAVQYDLMHPKQAKDKLADKVSAIRASLLLYRTIRASDKKFKRPVLDNLAALDKKGQLPQHVRSVMSKWTRGDGG